MNISANFPDSLPLLSSGAGDAAAGRACAMSAVHWMEGGAGNSDAPACVHPILRRAFIDTNDAGIWVDDAHRTRVLWPLIARAMGTAPTGTIGENHRVSVQLAVFAGRYVLPLTDYRNRKECQMALDAAQAWWEIGLSEKECDQVFFEADEALAKFFNQSDASYHAGHCATQALHSVHYGFSMMAGTAAIASAFSASRAKDEQSKVKIQEKANNPVAFLVALLDEHARLTQHQPAPLDLRGLDSLVPTATL